ncbi:MAG: TAT-variant-translocated molybdopterin oxidoreductase [Raineya sp.]|jgi:molybdopterin-containing oxidoreductase family iron-sulfur binding subunit|nr:TAT-variant-translocated molybdopterin oxidoreductase [Raineya sp.]
MENKKIYWKGFEELTNDLEFVKKAEKEFPDFLPIAEKDEENNTSRRDFLKLMGFGMAAVSLAACEAPVKKAIPYLNKPEDIDPSIPNYYATTYFQDGEYCSILVKTREGRPIKIEGNTLSKVTKGGTSARVQASVLNLYDLERLNSFMDGGKKASKDSVDSKILSALQATNGTIYIVSNTIISPSTKSVIAEFAKKYPSTKHVSYDAVSAYGILKANEKSFGVYGLPNYDFSKAETIVSINADFLGTWLSSIEYSRQYTQGRKLSKEKKTMSRHYQFETGLSLSGANADHRVAIRPSQEGLVVAQLYNEVVGGGSSPITDKNIAEKIKKAADDLKAQKGRSLVVCGSNDVNVQILVNAINDALTNYGSTLSITQANYTKQGNDEEMAKFVEDLKGGSVGAVIFYGTNPVYDYPKGKEIADALKNVALSISFSDRVDETSKLCKFITPDTNYLESWNDAFPTDGNYSLTQPAISPIYPEGTRQAQDSFLTWSGSKNNYYDVLRGFWKTNILKGQAFNEAWTKALHDGVYETNAKVATVVTPKDSTQKETKPAQEVKPVPTTSVAFKGDAAGALSAVSSAYKADNAKTELAIYQKVGLGSGAMANNPWLQEFPDPITKATWDNYALISKSYASQLGVETGSMVKVTVGGSSITLPVIVQPGQQKNTVSIALGYGRISTGKCGNGVGQNVYPMASFQNGSILYAAYEVAVAKAEGKVEMALTQTHQTLMGRGHVREANLTEYNKNPKLIREKYDIFINTADGPKKPTELTMWKGHEEAYNKNHWWGLTIDLNSCTGCGACVIACQTENNVPVVGKQEIINAREMHWIRIDRYYSTDADTSVKSMSNYEKMEDPSENPEVVFLPVMCQHCNNAPCETVCPVVATTHSSEGLNQMTYNRCIGTRYCANNCPFKVRRFNWFNYTNDEKFTTVNFMSQSDLGKMVLNPDVTVRSRGVMEKCSLCVQRIQAGKLEAKKEKRKVKDGDVVTACQQSCPADAIIFGDMNDPESRIAKTIGITKNEQKDIVLEDERAYHLLEEINVKANVTYLAKIRNKA